MKSIIETAKECGGTDLYEITEKITDINVMVLRPHCLSAFADRIRQDARAEFEREHRTQMTVGQLIDALAQENQAWPVRIERDDDYPRAAGIGSYRGYYEQLAIGSTKDGGNALCVGELLAKLRAQVGNTVTGYKGGAFRISLETPVWAAEYGECGPMVVGIDLRDYFVTLLTEIEE